jgi:hypothetical protein
MASADNYHYHSDRFPTVVLLVNHLRSPTVHIPKQKAVCPACRKPFKSIPALVAHCESESRRCYLRYTDKFRPFLDQLTAGIADLDGQWGDKTNRYVVTREAVEKYGSKDSRIDAAYRDRMAYDAKLKSEPVMKQCPMIIGDSTY